MQRLLIYECEDVGGDKLTKTTINCPSLLSRKADALDTNSKLRGGMEVIEAAEGTYTTSIQTYT